MSVQGDEIRACAIVALEKRGELTMRELIDAVREVYPRGREVIRRAIMMSSQILCVGTKRTGRPGAIAGVYGLKDNK